MDTQQVRVWFNEGLSVVREALQLIRGTDTAGELVLLASDHRAGLVEHLAEEAWREPGELRGEDYARWALEQCRERGVQVFLPSRERAAIAAMSAEFETAGTKLILVGGPEVFAVLADKILFMEALEDDGGVLLPEWAPYQILDEFDAAHARLRPRHRLLCVKPAHGMFAHGFKILTEKAGDHRPEPGQIICPLEDYRAQLAEKQPLKPHLLMEYLPGLECSIDCLGEKGKLLAAVVREKYEGYQLLKCEGEEYEIAESITEALGLSGLYNIQLRRNSHGRMVPLEANSRMAGGIGFACKSGMVLPYLAVMHAAGRLKPEDFPEPQHGIRVPTPT